MLDSTIGRLYTFALTAYFVGVIVSEFNPTVGRIIRVAAAGLFVLVALAAFLGVA
jgi:hypothetical protein